MIHRFFVRAISLALAFTACTASTAADKFNFNYRSIGESDLRPIQAFDNGERTFLQMRGTIVPAVFVTTEGKSVMLQVRKAGEYLVVPAVSGELTLKYATLTARLLNSANPQLKTVLASGSEVEVSDKPVPVTAGALRAAPVVQPTTFGATKPLIGDYLNDSPFLERDSLVSFKKGSTVLMKDQAAKVLSALAGYGAPVKVVITGRDDQAYVEGMARARAIAIRDRVIAAGVPLDRIVVKEGIARDSESNFISSDLLVVWKQNTDVNNGRTPTATPRSATSQQAAQDAHGKWEMRKSDKTVSGMLARWAASEGWTMVWLAPASADPKITGDATVVADEFTEALKLVISQSVAMGYPLTHTLENKVLTIK